MSFTIFDLVTALIAALGAETGRDAGIWWAQAGVDLLMLVGLGGILHKAGKPAVACAVPVLAELMVLAAIGRPRWWAVILLAPVLGLVAAELELSTYGLGPALGILGYVTICVVYVLLVERFGKSTGHYLGVILLPFVFLPLLGFGPAEYRLPFERRRRGRGDDQTG